MNITVSLEEVLAPVGESSAPEVGLMIGDWDENTWGVIDQIVTTGHSVRIVSSSREVTMESINPLTKINEPDDAEPQDDPQVIFYYKGKGPDAVLEGIPVLTVMEGKVQVSHEGRMKELAEFLGMLDHEGPGW